MINHSRLDNLIVNWKPNCCISCAKMSNGDRNVQHEESRHVVQA